MANDIDYEINPASALKAMRQIQQGQADLEKGVVGAADRMKAGWDSLEKGLISVNDRAEASNRRLVRSVISRNEAYGKSPIQKVIQEQNELIKRLNLEGSALDKVTASYRAKIKAMEAEAGAGKGGGFFSGGGSGILALRGARDIFEGRMAYGEIQLGKSLLGMAPVAGVIAGVTAAVAGLAIAGKAAAASLGELGVTTHDIELRTGLSAREVGQFGLIAKSVGQDITIAERAMRGLTIAVEDNSEAGQKGRDRLKSFGVDIAGVREGVIPTSQVLQQLSAGLNALPDQWTRNIAVIDIFKRVGVEMLPFLLGIKQGIEDTNGLKFLTEDQRKQFESYHKELTYIGHEWDMLAIKLKEPLAATVMVALRWFSGGSKPDAVRPLTHGGTSSYNSNAGQYGLSTANIINQQDFMNLIQNRIGDQMMGQFGAQATMAPEGPTGRGIFLSSLESGGSLEAAQAKESRLRRAYDLSRQDLETGGGTATLSSVTANKTAYESQRDLVKSMQKSEAELQSNTEALRKLQSTMGELSGKQGKSLPAAADFNEYMKRPGLNQGQISAAYATARPVFLQEQQELKDKMIAEAREQMTKEGAKILGIPTADELAKGDRKSGGADFESLIKQNEQTDKQLTEQLRGWTAALKQDRAGVEIRSESQAKVAAILSGRHDLTAQMAGAEGEAAAQRTKSNQEYQDAKNLIDAKYSYTEGHEKLFAQERISMEAYLQDIRSKHITELAQIQAKVDEEHAQEIRKQLDETKHAAESLFTTLFTHPSKFGSQLGSTLKSAALQPLVGGLSEMTAQGLQGLLHGPDGKGGLAAAMRFGGGGPLAGLPIHNNAMNVRVVNPSAVAADKTTVNVSGGGGGGTFGLPFGGATSTLAALAPLLRLQFAGGGMSGGGGGTGSSSPFGMTVSSGTFTGGGGYPSLGTFASDLGGLTGGGTGGGGFGGGGYSPSSGTNSSVGLLRRIFGGGGTASGKGIFGGFNLDALKSSFGIGEATKNVRNVGIFGDTTIGDAGTSFGSVASSQGAGSLYMAAGLPLAMAGLTGVHRGTGLGIAESTLGGAGVGAGIGTMILPGLGTAIGAGVGAAAGFVAGGLEDLLGVKSDREKAKSQIQSRYHISISNSMADQVANIAKSKYGDNVSVAVASPEVRQMLGLYAAGTGQAGKFPTSADTPMGGSLAEQGGTLYQTPRFQYGNPYTYQSNLPVLGGNAGGTLPNPGGTTLMSFNVDGASTSSFLDGGVFSPEAVGNKMTANWGAAGGRTMNAMQMQDPTGTVS